MSEHQAQLYRIAFSYLKNETDALEAVQEVTYRAYMNIHKVKKSEYAKTWLIRIMMNYCLDELRKRGRAQVGLEGLKEPEAPSNLDVSDRLLLEDAVQQLDESYQLIILLKYFHDMTLSEVANSLGIPLGTVKTRLHKALELLRKDLSKGGAAHESYR
ncbi:sigma-70 family RNA polymerase sigma factor [Pullulanibacillus sp. KACC 23026]|uniref:sigma-70 family RNA polymerase sigma factor n=1 Tax=Pullulanibacillus sp. KACC 23026 TaxID=3028315 RepID=UPI0023B06DBA|nr:sigma-70 family RNA polymerase sigma factor [Pullulanibacillus sp. KACC 23026]WEG12010.1 sigma-70 family RNA polymerase sigma factor [Pullulanibacillus sp. KACC 23026]